MAAGTPAPVSATMMRIRFSDRRALTLTDPRRVCLKALDTKFTRIMEIHEASLMTTCGISSLTWYCTVTSFGFGMKRTSAGSFVCITSRRSTGARCGVSGSPCCSLATSSAFCLSACCTSHDTRAYLYTLLVLLRVRAFLLNP